METITEVKRADDGSFGEIATVILDGREFTNWGATCDMEAGRMYAYWSGAKTGARDEFNVVDFEGNVLARARVVNAWQNWTPYADNYRQRRYAISFAFQDYRWHGIAHGPEMYLRAKRGKRVLVSQTG